MLGLKCAGTLPGFTRLADEFLMALDFLDDDSLFGSDEGAFSFVDEAIRRVRSFARGGADVRGTARTARGLALFELQGYDYAAAFGREEITGSPGSFEALGERLRALANDAKSKAEGEHVPVGILFVALVGDSAEEIEGTIEEARRNGFTEALAYSIPTKPEETSAPWYGDRYKGVLFAAARPAEGEGAAESSS